MVSSSVKTVAEYLKSLPPERRKAISTVRQVILDNLPKGYVEGMNWGMIVYEIPLKRYPNTYNGQPLGIAAIASQKQYMSLYLMTIYGKGGKLETWFRNEFAKRDKKLNMGKSCVRFKKLDDLPLDVIGQIIRKVSVDAYIRQYEATRGKRAR